MLDLTTTSQINILESSWILYVEEQAIVCVHNTGQQKPVRVHCILIPNMVGDRILDFRDRKRALIRGSLGPDTGMEPLKLEKKSSRISCMS